MQPPPRHVFAKVPVDERFREWRTNQFERTVLVVVRTATGLTRALDVLSLIQTDHRIQTVFTHDVANTAVFGAGMGETLDSLQASVIPWEQAVKTRFDLALAASENDDLHELDAPILLLPHGLGYQKYYPGSRVIAGMNPNRLLHKGKIIPAVLGLSHSDQCEQLRTSCPTAAGHAAVVGDPCLDRILVSRHRVRRYREALGATDKKLVFLGSTWGSGSLFGSDPALPERLLAELPVDEYRVALSLHAGVWAHGPGQVRAWLSRARESGLSILPSHEGWRAAVLAADLVVSDRGSLSLYAAATDTPLLLACGADDTTVADSPMAALAAQTPRLDSNSDLRWQIEAATHNHIPAVHAPIIKQAVENPGESARTLRDLLYRLLRLSEPDSPAEFDPVPVPEPDESPVSTFLVGGRPDEDAVSVERYPSRPHHPGLGYQHLAADLDHARLSALDAATILYLPEQDFRAHSQRAFRQWPNALITAAVSGPRTCMLATRDGQEATFTMSAQADPLLVASLAYIRITMNDRLPGKDRLRIGHRLIEVTPDAPARQDTGKPWGG